MADPEDDAELAKAIGDRTTPVYDPTEPANPIEGRDAGERDTGGDDSQLGQNVDDFEIDLPPPEGFEG